MPPSLPAPGIRVRRRSTVRGRRAAARATGAAAQPDEPVRPRLRPRSLPTGRQSRHRTIRAALLALATALLPLVASAHPHAETLRQAVLILAPDAVRIRLTLLPGTDEGPAFAARVDADGDGLVSEPEAMEKARALLAAAHLTWRGNTLPLAPLFAEATPADWLAAGSGSLTLEARAAADLAAGGTLIVEMPGWQLQPLYEAALVDGTGTPEVRPRPDGLVLRVPAP
ncbi:hypothetical protein [Jannaschia formosa]|uniref:hypothetical protein n=1 Tax=Jannaschia formosa TaxID=2259592 RepID=UPI000E1C1430|nr:hypothetical protein [Jannaschia formosa]TFL20137.1 hypothetical protein DR046_01965 [Jannaschia formosa]